jgi:hypothetical protein
MLTGGKTAAKGKYIQIKKKNDIPPVLNATKLFCRFKMDGCAHCVNSQKDWDKACKTVEGALNPECVIAEVETKLLPFFKLKNGFEPNGFPTHAVFKNGNHVEDAQDRSFKGLMNTLRKHQFVKKRTQHNGRFRRRPRTFRRRSFHY